MAALDVEHKVPAVQVLHHEEQVLLVGAHRQRQAGVTQWTDQPSVGDGCEEVRRGTDVKATVHMIH